MNTKKKTNQDGYIILINTLIFMAVSILILVGVINPIVSHYTSTKGFLDSKKSFQTANSAVEEVMYRLKTNKNTSNFSTLTLGSSTADISVLTSGNTKTISISGDSNNFDRNIGANMIQSPGANFSYGLQTGDGGIIMGNNSYVSGNVYSNGDIVGSNNSYITGSAIVSNTTDPTADQTNGTTTPPIYSINFGDKTGVQDVAQSFRISTTTNITSLRFYIKKIGTPNNDITVKIYNNSNSKPSTLISSQLLSGGKITASYNYVTIFLPTPISLSLNTTYWIVLDTSSSNNSGNYYSIAASSNTYTNGTTQIGTLSSGTWNNTSPSGLDIYFDIYVGGDYGSITGLDHIGTGSVGDAWAHSVSNINSIKGNLYCQTSNNIGGAKNCDTSRADPAEQSFPVSDGNIADWEAEAEAGGVYNGNKSYSSGTSYLGPIKINGNLTVNSATLKLTGTVYVTGKVSVSNNASINLDSAHYGSNSGVLIADGTIDIGNNGTLNGSGTSGSYILVITNSTCPIGNCDHNNALFLENNTSGTSILNAQKGTLEISNNATAKEATAKTIKLDQNASVIYETGMANPNFSTGPSGSWYFSSWNEQ